MKAQATYEIKQLKPHRFFVPKITLGFQNLAMNIKPCEVKPDGMTRFVRLQPRAKMFYWQANFLLWLAVTALPDSEPRTCLFHGKDSTSSRAGEIVIACAPGASQQIIG
jgi:hypothetical protein